MQQRQTPGGSDPLPCPGITLDRALSPGPATCTRLMHKEEGLERLRRQQSLSTSLSIKGQDESQPGEGVRGRGQHASDSGYGTDSPGYTGHFPGHYRPPRQTLAPGDIPTSDSDESDDLHDALSVSSAADDDDVFVADMMTVYFEENQTTTPNMDDKERHANDLLDDVDGDAPPGREDTSGAEEETEERGAVGGVRPRALPLTIPTAISTAVDIPASPRHRSPNVNFTPPRFYSGNTSFPFPPSPTLFGSPESVFTFGRRAPPPSNLQRSLHIVALRERVLSETDMTRARTQSESAATSSRNQALPSCFRDRSYSESAIQIRLQRRVGRELRRISDEFHVSYTSPSSSPSAIPNGVREGLHTSRSFPGGSRGATWWQNIIQQFSPFFGQRLETIESPVDAIDDPFFANDSQSSDEEESRSEQSSTSARRRSRVTFNLGFSEIDSVDDVDNDLDDLDGVQ